MRWITHLLIWQQHFLKWPWAQIQMKMMKILIPAQSIMKKLVLRLEWQDYLSM
jgi:hypothetical protein